MFKVGIGGSLVDDAPLNVSARFGILAWASCPLRVTVSPALLALRIKLPKKDPFLNLFDIN